jgi:hypothetical protein
MGTINENIGPFSRVGGLGMGVVDPVTRASAVAMPASVAGITTVSGTAALSTIDLPWAGFTGSIRYIPTAAFTGVTGGTATDVAKPIGLAFTAVIGKVLEMTFDGVKWYPSYTA